MTVIPWRGPTAREQAKSLHPANGPRRPARGDPDEEAPASPPVAALWDEAVCRSHLACATEGHLSCSSSGVHDLLVPFALTRSGLVVVPTAVLGDLAAALSGRRVTLEVSGRAAGAGCWVVRLTGTAVDRVVVPDGSGARAPDRSTGSRPGGRRAEPRGIASLAIPVHSLAGYQRTGSEAGARRVART